nr:PH10-2-44(-2) [Vibrio phage 1]
MPTPLTQHVTVLILVTRHLQSSQEVLFEYSNKSTLYKIEPFSSS